METLGWDWETLGLVGERELLGTLLEWVGFHEHSSSWKKFVWDEYCNSSRKWV